MNNIANTQSSTWNRLVAYGEENRFGLICLALLVVGCLGGVTMALGAAHSTALLIGIVVPTMATLSLLLAVAPIKLIYYVFFVTVLIDISACFALTV